VGGRGEKGSRGVKGAKVRNKMGEGALHSARRGGKVRWQGSYSVGRGGEKGGGGGGGVIKCWAARSVEKNARRG